jgi:hypothetical protein
MFPTKLIIDKIVIWNRNGDGLNIARRIDRSKVNWFKICPRNSWNHQFQILKTIFSSQLQRAICLNSPKRTYSQVFLDKFLCGTIHHQEEINPYIIDCGSNTAREVIFVGGAVDGVLSLCEVKVFSSNPPGLYCNMLVARTLLHSL